MEKEEGLIISGVNVMSLIRSVMKLNKRHQATILSDLEQIMDKDSEEFKFIRKSVLDNTNNFSRSVLGIIFGDIDYSWH